MKKILLIAIMIGFPVFTAARERLPELKTVEYVDLSRGGGTWYEIARITHWYEKGLVGVKANLQTFDNGKVEIVNSWYKGSLDGKQKTWRGKGKVSDRNTNAKLKVTFFWPFYSEYCIIDLCKDYGYAVIGEPERKCAWIFAKTPTLDPEVYNGILERLREQGYDTDKLDTTLQ